MSILYSIIRQHTNTIRCTPLPPTPPSCSLSCVRACEKKYNQEVNLLTTAPVAPPRSVLFYVSLTGPNWKPLNVLFGQLLRAIYAFICQQSKRERGGRWGRGGTASWLVNKRVMVAANDAEWIIRSSIATVGICGTNTHIV